MRLKEKTTGLLSLNKNWRFFKEDIDDLPKGRKHDDMYGYSKAGGRKYLQKIVLMTQSGKKSNCHMIGL